MMMMTIVMMCVSLNIYLQIKVWVLPEETSMGNVSEPAVVLPAQDRRIENILWHPTAEGVLAVSTHTSVKLFDVASAAEKSGSILVKTFAKHGNCPTFLLLIFMTSWSKWVSYGCMWWVVLVWLTDCPSVSHSKNFNVGHYTQTVQTTFLITAVLRGTIIFCHLYYFHWLWPCLVLQGISFISPHTFQLIKMKYDVVLKQFCSNSLWW